MVIEEGAGCFFKKSGPPLFYSLYFLISDDPYVKKMAAYPIRIMREMTPGTSKTSMRMTMLAWVRGRM